MAAAITIIHGDALEQLAELEPESFDASITDPPYGIGFMGRHWDTFAARDLVRYQRWTAAWASLTFRALRPGGWLLAFSGTRTYHRLACGVEDAGFEVRDFLDWIYGTGFPKSIDGEREVARALCQAPGRHYLRRVPPPARRQAGDHVCASTEASRAFAGVGSALKPAHEAILLARKPFQGRIGDQLARVGLGGLQIDAARVGAPEGDRTRYGIDGDEASSRTASVYGHRLGRREPYERPPAGRWPPNVLLSHLEGCQPVGRVRVPTGTHVGHNRDGDVEMGGYSGGLRKDTRDVGYADSDGRESVEAWLCAEGCPVALLNAQSGSSETPESVGRGASSRAITLQGLTTGPLVQVPSYGDAGGASRFFPTFRYEPKPFRDERDLGCEALEARSGGQATNRVDGDAGIDSPRSGAGRKGGARNHHPTVKPLGLVRWLVRLVAAPGARVLEPFAGSGTTAMACKVEGVDCVAFEREADFVEIARLRVAAVDQAALLTLAEGLEAEPEAPDAQQVEMFQEDAP